MTEVTTPPEGEAPTTTATDPPEDQRVPYERFEKANKQAKEAKDRASKLEKDMADLRAQLEERESAGLPELEQTRKRLEQAEKRAQDAEQAREQSERQVALSKAERWVLAAAKNFIDADDAVRNVDLSDIEDADTAERAVKRVAKAKPHLLKGEDKPLPGKVLDGGRAVSGEAAGRDALASAAAGAQLQEATDLAAELKKHLKT